MRVLNRAFDHPLELEERAADPLAGGLMRGYQCGMVWGAALAAGAQAHQLFGTGPQTEVMALTAAQRIAASFRAQNKSINCYDITGIDIAAAKPGTVVRFLIKSAPTGSCFGMAARCAPAAFREINAVCTQEPAEAISAPLSCAALLAQKMGASELHTVMAAGLGGGIGLSGGGCGALGAALWIIGMNSLRKGDELDLNSSVVLAAIEGFAKYTGQKFECTQITGCKFDSAADHAAYLHAGGCLELIDALAAK